MLKRKIRSLIPMLLVASLLTSCSHERGIQQNCEPWSKVSRGEYVLTNNVWGSKGQKNYRQCITLDNTIKNMPPVYGWEWKWQGHNGNVIAYPSVLYGFKPWNSRSTTASLPIKVGEVKTLTVQYNIEQHGEGSHNILLESWVSTSSEPKSDTRTAEIAIHLFQQNWPGMPGELIETLEMDGRRFDFYAEPSIVVPGDSHRWSYLGFVNKDRFVPEGTVNMALFTNFLADRGYIDKEHYLASVELGSELVKGSGKTKLRWFDVIVSEK